MRILVAHDREDVMEQIRSHIESMKIDNCVVAEAVDGTSTRRCLTSHMFDLLIIDLTLPHIHGRDNPSYQTVDNLLNEIFMFDDMKVPGDIIGITLDLDALKLVKNNIGQHIMAALEQDTAGDWKIRLSEKIQYVIRASKSRQNSVNTNHDIDCLLVTALDKELVPHNNFFEFQDIPNRLGLKSFFFKDKDAILRKGIAFAIGKSGEARAASHTQSLISEFRPKCAIMTGICGGPKGKMKLGDLVVAESAIDWDYGKWSEEDVSKADKDEAIDTNASLNVREKKMSVFLPRPDPVSIFGKRSHGYAREFLASNFLKDPAVLKKITQMSAGKITEPSIELAPMASGSSVIASDEILGRIRGLNESIRGIDMEAYGFYHAAFNTHVKRPEVICIKAVSDYSNGTKGDGYHEGCSFISAFSAYYMLSQIWQF